MQKDFKFMYAAVEAVSCGQSAVMDVTAGF